MNKTCDHWSSMPPTSLEIDARSQSDGPWEKGDWCDSAGLIHTEVLPEWRMQGARLLL